MASLKLEIMSFILMCRISEGIALKEIAAEVEMKDASRERKSRHATERALNPQRIVIL